MSRWMQATALAVFYGLFLAQPAQGQITTQRTLSASTRQSATLTEQLTNRLRATTEDKRAYIARIVQLVEAKKLDTRLVVAIERYALRRHPAFPFPYFERALKVEAAKRGVTVPTVREVMSTRSTIRR